MPLKLAVAARGTVAGHRLGNLEGGVLPPPPPNASLRSTCAARYYCKPLQVYSCGTAKGHIGPRAISKIGCQLSCALGCAVFVGWGGGVCTTFVAKRLLSLVATLAGGKSQERRGCNSSARRKYSAGMHRGGGLTPPPLRGPQPMPSHCPAGGDVAHAHSAWHCFVRQSWHRPMILSVPQRMAESLGRKAL